MLPLDRIWCRPVSALVEVRAHTTGLATAASDHLPLRAELRLCRGGLGEMGGLENDPNELRE